MMRQKIDYMDTLLITAEIHRGNELIALRFLFIAVVLIEEFHLGYMIGQRYKEKGRYFYDVRFN